MTIIFEERLSDSPFVETITYGHTMSDGSPLRPAEINWHMVLVRQNGGFRPLVVGPWRSAGLTTYTEGAEILWIKFKLAVFMPHLPPKKLLDAETVLPEAAGKSFWLKGTAWQLPDHENVDTFINRLVREEVLARDPVVEAVLQGRVADVAPRTVRYRFLHAICH